jgi:hypothetical protein
MILLSREAAILPHVPLYLPHNGAGPDAHATQPHPVSAFALLTLPVERNHLKMTTTR